MDQLSQDTFDKLVKLNPEDLTLEQRQFLFARRDYLNNEQKKVFASIVEVKEEKVKESK